MTEDETLTLMMALVADNALTSNDIAQGLGKSVTGAWSVANSLRSAGALVKPRYNQWTITEKGRIACALAMAKDPDLHAAFFE